MSNCDKPQDGMVTNINPIATGNSSPPTVGSDDKSLRESADDPTTTSRPTPSLTISSPDPPPVPTSRQAPHPRALFEEAEDSLAQSLLIFLYADLRLLSATGRIHTKYETLRIDSDWAARNSASELAAVSGSPRFVKRNGEHGPGRYRQEHEWISPAQIMAILLIELRKEVQAHRKWSNRTFARINTNESVENPAVQEGEFLLASQNGKEKKKKFEDDMHALLKAYNEMIGEDLNVNIPKFLAHRQGPGYLTGSGAGPGSPVRSGTSSPTQNRSTLFFGSIRRNRSGGSSATASDARHQQHDLHHAEFSDIPEGDEENDEEQQQRRERKEEEEEGEATGDGDEDVSPPTTGIRRMDIVNFYVIRANEQRKALFMNEQQIDQHNFEVVGDALFNMGKSCRQLRQSLPTSDDKALSNDELLHFMEAAVKSRVMGKLDFMTSFFQDGSVSQLLVKSKAKVVWLNDWYPIKDLIYAISVDEEKRRVLVVFRGAITRADWNHIFDFDQASVQNPVKDDFEGKPSRIKIHSGFYRYLFRRRKDTGTTKYDEIANVLHGYGSQIIGEDYSLYVTGHSLGGALSTLFGFYASTDERFTKNGPVRLFTFGSPYVGGYSFCKSFKYQEQSGKLQHARFHNVRDIVVHLPFNLTLSKRGSKYRHVGIGIKLPRRRHRLLACCTRHPKIHYSSNDGYFASSWRAIRDNFVFNSPLPWRIRLVHGLNEHQKRMIRGNEVPERGADGTGRKNLRLLSKSLDELYETLVLEEKN